MAKMAWRSKQRIWSARAAITRRLATAPTRAMRPRPVGLSFGGHPDTQPIAIGPGNAWRLPGPPLPRDCRLKDPC
jgi:hypothetical protein